jgi:mannose-6-phosphate isomerase-like protein (cupin superfamily)
MQKTTWVATVFLALYGLCGIGTAQAQQVDHYTPESLSKQSEPLKAKAAASNGVASETLEKYGVDYTMLSFRSQDGGAELHEKFADIFVVIDGGATLLSGGELVSPTASGPGEMRAASILHATSTTLAKGDVVHIPANTPHQLLIPKGTTLTYFVVKIKEKE